MSLTMIQKVLSRASGGEIPEIGRYLTVRPNILMLNDSFFRAAQMIEELGFETLYDPERIHIVIDHNVPPPSVEVADRHRRIKRRAAELGISGFHGYAGVSHQVLAERGVVRPGELVFGTDSHSSTYGALAAAGMGVGITDMVYAMVVGKTWLQVPRSLRIELRGAGGPGVMAMDLMLYLTRRLGREFGIDRSIEYCGPAVTRMPMGSRLTVANMSVELGCRFCFFPEDAIARHYMGIPEDSRDPGLESDLGAQFEQEEVVDLDQLVPHVAFPHDPGNTHQISSATRCIALDQAYIGSCTNGRLEDIKVAAEVVSGRRIANGVRFYITPASKAVMREATRAGYVEVLQDAGATFAVPGCGACFGANHVLAGGEKCISTTNRNFQGRMGSRDAEVFLASPATVAASALTGFITDPREFWSGGTLGS